MVLPTKLLPSGQWNQGSGPPYELKVGNIEKAVGCLRLILVGFFSLLISCCVSCAGVAVLMKDQNPAATFGVIFVVFIVVFFIIFKLSSWRFKKAYGKTAVLDINALVLNATDAGGSNVIPYTQVKTISITKSRSQQLGYRIELFNGTVHELDPDLATFPATNIPIENSVLPVVLQNWDAELFENKGGFLVNPEETAYQLRGACAFWIAVGTPLLFIPTWWGTLAEFYARAWRLYQQAKFCGDPFLITADGISSSFGSGPPIPLSDIRLAKQDDVAIVIESRSSGTTFMAPITARNAFTAGYWLNEKLRTGAFRNESPSEIGDQQGHGGRMSGLQSDLF